MIGLFPTPYSLDDGRLSTLADELGTPLVVYFEDVLRENALKLLNAFPPGVKLAYSVKANPNPFVLKTFQNLGMLAEAASEGEFLHALSFGGFAASDVFLGGPGMPEAALRVAADRGARAILLESENAIARAGRLGVSNIPILLRVNPYCLQTRVETRMTGIASPFGIDEPSIAAAIRFVEREGLNYAGLFQYVGTQVEGADAIATNTHHLLALSERLAAEGLPPARVLDCGGGFPVPESPGQRELDLQSLRKKLEDVKLFRRTAELEILFESGRYLVDNAAILLSRVLDTKISFGQHFVILDTGINALGLRQLKYRTFAPQIRVIGNAYEADRVTNFVGPTCTPIDVVAENVLAPPLKEGDLICVCRFGAYAVSFSPSAFCGYGYPTEVGLQSDGTVQLTRRKSAYPVGCDWE